MHIKGYTKYIKKSIAIVILIAVCLFSVLTITPLAYEMPITALPGDLSISAKAAVLIEAKTGKVLYAKNADTKLPMASTTKIMSTLLLLESGSLDSEFIVDSDAIMVEGSSAGLQVGDVVTKRVLAYGMMLPSGNDAANATAIKVGGTYEKFAEMMNARAREIGMTRTNFVTPSGLEAAGHGSSAYDMALLARTALQNPDFREICSTERKLLQFGNPPYDRYLNNTNKLLKQYPGTIGVKTGFTDEAGRCLVSACEKNGIQLIAVTLNAPDDWRDHAALYDNGFAILKQVKISLPQDLKIPVAGHDDLPLYVSSSVEVGAVDEQVNEAINFKQIVPPFIYLPEKDSQVGYLEIWHGEIMIERIPIYVSTDSKNNGR